MCTDSWERWYRKQWDKKSVQDRILRASNLIAQDAYNVIYAWDRRGFDLIAAGFKDLSLSQLQQMLDLAAAKTRNTQVQLPPDVLERWEQASSLINAITVDEFEGWFNALSQAIEQGRSEEEYNRLLPLGLERLEQALLILMESEDSRKVKELIYKAAQVWARLAQISEGVSDEIQQRMDEVRNRLMSNFLFLQWLGCGLVPGACDILQVLGVEDAFGLVELLIRNWDTAVRVLHTAGFSDQELLDFSRALHVIVADYLPEYFAFATDVLAKLRYTKDLASFLDWMTSPYIQDRTVRDRLEQGYGTIVVAGNSVLQGNWEYKGLRLDQEGSYTQEGFGNWWGAVLLLPKEQSPGGRSIVAVARGDHCANCEAKADEISS